MNKFDKEREESPQKKFVIRFYRCKICLGFSESLDNLVTHWVISHGIKVAGPPKVIEFKSNPKSSLEEFQSSESDFDTCEDTDHEDLSDFDTESCNKSPLSLSDSDLHSAFSDLDLKEGLECVSIDDIFPEDKSTTTSDSNEESSRELGLEGLGSIGDIFISESGAPIIRRTSARLHHNVTTIMNLDLSQNQNQNQNNTGYIDNRGWTPDTSVYLTLPIPSPSEMLSESPSGDASYACPVCNIQFQTRSQLMGHTRKHMKDKLFQCKLCEQNFPSHKELKSHMGDKTETDEFSITCGICSRTFPSQACLTHHLNCHKQAGSAPVIIDNPASERRYSCSLCSKTFKNSQHVQRHLRIHTGEKPFSCTLCGQSFSLNHNLQRHMRTHTGEKPHKCPVCSKEFAEGHNLKRHMISAHDGPTPYMCTICNRKFAENSILKKHQNKAHKNAVNNNSNSNNSQNSQSQ